jgi:hypothetical protein
MADTKTPWRALLVMALIAAALLVAGYCFGWELP